MGDRGRGDADHKEAERRDADRRDAGRLARLAEEELPALIARFEQSGLGELEIHRDEWKIRLRRSAPVPMTGTVAGSAASAGVAAGRQAKRARTEAGLGQVAVSLGPVPRDPAATGSSSPSGNGQQASLLAAVGPGRGGDAAGSARRRRVATSPAVGYFAPLEGLTSGHQVRSGDLLGHVDVLGVRQDVISPMDGIVVRVLAEPGQAVEYGEELVRVDVMSRSSDPAGGGGDAPVPATPDRGA